MVILYQQTPWSIYILTGATFGSAIGAFGGYAIGCNIEAIIGLTALGGTLGAELGFEEYVNDYHKPKSPLKNNTTNA